MLDAVSTGLHPSAVVGQLAGKYSVSERCLWSDWQRRAKWVPVVLGLERFAGFADVVEQKLSAVERAAWAVYLKASNDMLGLGLCGRFLRLWRSIVKLFRQAISLIGWVGLRRLWRNRKSGDSHESAR